MCLILSFSLSLYILLFQRLFGKKCGGCGQQIAGGFLQAMGKDWHPEHFVCYNCGMQYIFIYIYIY